MNTTFTNFKIGRHWYYVPYNYVVCVECGVHDEISILIMRLIVFCVKHSFSTGNQSFNFHYDNHR